MAKMRLLRIQVHDFCRSFRIFVCKYKIVNRKSDMYTMPIGVLIILLIIAFFQWRARQWDKKEREYERKAHNLYFHLTQFSLEDQAYVLNHGKPFYLRGYFKRMYRFACKRWDETGSIYDAVSELFVKSRRSRQLRRRVKLRQAWRWVQS